MSLAITMRKLADAWPREEFPDRTIALYAERLGRYPEEQVAKAVDDLVGTEKWRPSVGQIIDRVSERALNLPTTEEAWVIAQRGSLRDAQEPVREAADQVGGRWNILHSENPVAVRAQFVKAYANIRRQALLDHATGGRPELNGVRRAQLGPTMRALPESDRIRPRPVLSRLTARWAGRPLAPPTDEEKSDAIDVLREGPAAAVAADDPMYAEAERIFIEGAA